MISGGNLKKKYHPFLPRDVLWVRVRVTYCNGYIPLFTILPKSREKRLKNFFPTFPKALVRSSGNNFFNLFLEDFATGESICRFAYLSLRLSVASYSGAD